MPQSITVPIFPLPGVFLAPGQLLPLHIFEPRYREMLAFALEHDERLAMAHPQPDRSEEPGSAPIFPVCGLGKIERAEVFPDGRANILLRGEARLAVEAELPKAHAFRMVHGRCLPETTLSEPAEEWQQFQRLLLGLDPALRAELSALPLPQQVDALLPRLDASTAEKLLIFGEPDVRKRLAATLSASGFGLHHRLDPGSSDPSRN